MVPIIPPFLVTNELITQFKTKGKKQLTFILPVKAIESILIAQFLPIENTFFFFFLIGIHSMQG